MCIYIYIYIYISEDNRISGYFCSDTVFNLSRRVLSEDEIKVLEKGLDFAPIQNKVNESELRKDFDEFYRRMRIKWYFRNEPPESFSTIPAFRSKSSWKPPTGHPNLEVFLSSVEKQLFEDIGTFLRYSNLNTEEWKATRSLADDRSIVIKKQTKALLWSFGKKMTILRKPEDNWETEVCIRRLTLKKNFCVS